MMSFHVIAEPWMCSVGQRDCTCCDLGNGTGSEFLALVLESSWHQLNFGSVLTHFTAFWKQCLSHLSGSHEWHAVLEVQPHNLVIS